MKRFCIGAILGWMCCAALQAQSVGNILREVERNNRELSAQRKNDEASKIGIKAENAAEDPSVEYISLYNKEVEGQSASELIVSQGFDFPTLYGARHREGLERKEAINHRYEALRRKILLDAKMLCLDLIHFNRVSDLLDARSKNADKLLKIYEERLQAGDVTLVEVNKIKMERMSIQTEVLKNNAAHRTALQALLALNGNMPLEFDEKEYPAAVVTKDVNALFDEIVGGEAEIHAADAELRAAEQAVKVNRQRWLPHLEVGYRRNTTADGPKEHGFIVGGSLPLFSNRKQVKMARLQSEEARMTLDDVRLKTEAEAHGRINEMQQLRKAMDIYDMNLMQQTLELLKEGVEKGEISTVDYFTEANGIYQNMQVYMELENNYHKTVATLYRNRL